MSNLYKQQYTQTHSGTARVINSNHLLEEKLQRMAQQVAQVQEFTDGILDAEAEDRVVMTAPEPTPAELKAEAERILEEAREQAEQLLSEARLQSDQIAQEARKNGQQEGFQQGMEQAKLELEQRQTLLEQRELQLEQEYDELRRNLEPQLVEAICQVISRVFSVQLDNIQEILLYLVEQTILKIEHTRSFVIRISPDNHTFLEEHTEQIRQNVGQNVTLEVETDAALDDTQCVIETDSGFFDCSIDVELENLLKAIRTLSM